MASVQYVHQATQYQSYKTESAIKKLSYNAPLRHLAAKVYQFTSSVQDVVMKVVNTVCITLVENSF